MSWRVWMCENGGLVDAFPGGPKDAPGGTQWTVGVPGCEGPATHKTHFQAGQRTHLRLHAAQFRPRHVAPAHVDDFRRRVVNPPPLAVDLHEQHAGLESAAVTPVRLLDEDGAFVSVPPVGVRFDAFFGQETPGEEHSHVRLDEPGSDDG